MVLTLRIPDPPTSFTIGRRKYYASANMFYSGMHHFARAKVVEAAKWVIFPHIRDLTPMKSRIRVDLTMQNRSNGTQDPDALYFWVKMFMDSIKGRAIPDDSKKYVSRVSMGFEPGDPAIIITIEEGL